MMQLSATAVVAGLVVVVPTHVGLFFAMGEGHNDKRPTVALVIVSALAVGLGIISIFDKIEVGEFMTVIFDGVPVITFWRRR
jgi:hypothetical protein